MEKFHLLCVIASFMCVTGSIKWEMANITCTTGIFQVSA